MKQYVIDASVAIKWFLPDANDESNTLEALALLLRLKAGEVIFTQPVHWKAEVAGVLVRLVPETAADTVDDLSLLEGIEYIDAPNIYRRAIDLAQTLNHHLFDTLYHAAALETGITFITADRRYHDKAAHLGSIVLLERFARMPPRSNVGS
ncbi:MAG: type II toxin-antitoxin system VapC family toxin [Betaproteobacteria bacterium]|nr:type II toxin-antitoxin system VapC family toxin [Betaproteobacteria bacterium]